VKLRKIRVALHLSLIAGNFLFGFGRERYVAGGPLSADQARYDVVYYDLNLKIDPARQYLSGYVDVRFRSCDSALTRLELDLIDRYTVERATAGEEALPFTHERNKLFIRLPIPVEKDSLATVRIAYFGKPPVARRPPWDGGFNWDRDARGAPWVGVSCQGEGAKIWWPCKDHPSDEPDSVAINITIPDTLVCASNGLLQGVTDAGDGWRTWHWKTRYPINNYSVTVNIADYVVRRRPYRGAQAMDIVFYVLPEDTAGAAELLEQAEEMLSFYARRFGEYPFLREKFGLAQTAYYGMEHQTINSYGNRYRNTALGYDFLLLHEMGHEWWGNYLTADDWADFWLHEGIDIYAEALFIEERYGEAEYLRFFRETARPKIRNRRPIVPHRNATTAEAYSIDVYYKGAYVLHMLRYLLGKAAVDSLLREFLRMPKGRPHNHATTADFIALVERFAGADLRWFFNRYLRQAELPVLRARVEQGQTETTLTLRWLTADFALPVEVAVRTPDGERRERLPVGSLELVRHYPPGSTVTIDPEGWILYAPPRLWWSWKTVTKWGLGLLVLVSFHLLW
jgi:aminopeptidase N